MPVLRVLERTEGRGGRLSESGTGGRLIGCRCRGSAADDWWNGAAGKSVDFNGQARAGYRSGRSECAGGVLSPREKREEGKTTTMMNNELRACCGSGSGSARGRGGTVLMFDR